MHNMPEILMNSQKLMLMKYAKISNQELQEDPGLDSETFARFTQLWMMEAIK